MSLKPPGSPNVSLGTGRVLWNVQADYGAYGNGTTDDTTAIQNAINAANNAGGGIVFFPAGTYLISSTLTAYTGLIQLVGVGWASIIKMSTDNTSILDFGASGNRAFGLWLTYSNVQGSANTNAVAIRTVQLYESALQFLRITNCYTGIGVPQSTIYGKTTNYLFSCSIEHLEISQYSGYGIYIKGYGGVGNTGSAMKNIYIYNQQTRGSATLLTAKAGIHLEDMGECHLDQCNVEWGKLTEGAYSIVNSESAHLTSCHTEGLQFMTNQRGVYEVFNSRAIIESCRSTANVIDTGVATGVAVVYVDAVSSVRLENFTESGTTLNGKTLYRFWAPNNGAKTIRAQQNKLANATTDNVSPASVVRDDDTEFAAEDQALVGMLVPKLAVPVGTSTSVNLTANRAYYVRFVPARTFNITKIGFVVATAAGSDDACDVAIYDSAGTRLVSAGATTGKLNSTGAKTVDVTSTALKAGTVYYAAFSCGAIGTTAAQLMMTSPGATGFMDLFGTTIPTLLWGFQAAAHPLPAPAAVSNGVNNVPILVLRES